MINWQNIQGRGMLHFLDDWYLLLIYPLFNFVF